MSPIQRPPAHPPPPANIAANKTTKLTLVLAGVGILLCPLPLHRPHTGHEIEPRARKQREKAIWLQQPRARQWQAGGEGRSDRGMGRRSAVEALQPREDSNCNLIRWGIGWVGCSRRDLFHSGPSGASLRHELKTYSYLPEPWHVSMSCSKRGRRTALVSVASGTGPSSLAHFPGQLSGTY